ncbi:unnamed protein product [Dicrocoelium dendriticum]|nr:unnamed protein product [Dicrocoelium dendriticum]
MHILNTPRIIHNPQLGSRQIKLGTRRNATTIEATENSTMHILNTPRIIHNPQLGSRQIKLGTRRNATTIEGQFSSVFKVRFHSSI